MAENLVEAVRERAPELSRQEGAVAALLLADPQALLHMPLNRMAERAGVSQPTVIRFCRTMGCEGLRDFKLRLAHSLALGGPFLHTDVDPEDDAARYTTKVIDATLAAVADLRGRLDPVAIEGAVDRLAAARQLLFFGMGGSGPVALDAMHKFMRLQRPTTVAHTDPLLARMAVAGLGPDDALVVLSNTGRTLITLDVVALARGGGVPVVALTAPGSPLALAADHTVAIEPAEDVELFTPMASRIAHLVVVDILATGVGLRRGAGVREHLMRVKESLAPTRQREPA